MEEKGSSSPQLTPQGTFNVPDFILTSISRFKDRIAQVDSGTFRSITFLDIIGRATKLEQILSNTGVKKGDVIAIISKNTIDFCWIVLGCLASRAVCALFNPSSTSREIRHYLSLVRPTIVIAEELTKEQFFALQEENTVRRVYTNYVGNHSDKIFGFDNLVFQTVSGSKNVNKHNVFFAPTLNEPAFMLPSSGTTGMPKAVVLTHNNIIAALEQSGQYMRHGGVALGLMPFFHAYGLGLMLMALCEGTKLIAVQKFNLRTFLPVVSTFGVTHLHLVPSLVVTLGKSENVTPSYLESVREVMTGAGPITYEQQAALKRKLHPSARLFHSYGMTESTFVITFGEMREDKPGSIGTLVDGFKAKIVKENGELANNGETGELWVRGLMTFTSYHNNPEATEETLDKMRWLHSGDMVMRDDDGYFYHIERKKEYIKYQGFQVSPTEIEMILLQHKSVEEAAVIGIEHETFGEIPMAFVVKRTGQKVPEEELMESVQHDFNIVKTRLQAIAGTSEKPKFSGVVDTFIKTQTRRAGSSSKPAMRSSVLRYLGSLEPSTISESQKNLRSSFDPPNQKETTGENSYTTKMLSKDLQLQQESEEEPRRRS